MVTSNVDTLYQDFFTVLALTCSILVAFCFRNLFWIHMTVGYATIKFRRGGMGGNNWEPIGLPFRILSKKTILAFMGIDIHIHKLA